MVVQHKRSGVPRRLLSSLFIFVLLLALAGTMPARAQDTAQDAAPVSPATEDSAPAADAAQPTREANTPIEHFIVIMQENHSFDNYFGTYPGADGIPEGTCMPVDPFDESNTECVEPFLIGTNDVELADPDHSVRTHELQVNEGKMNGFVYALTNRNQDGRLAMGYYDDTHIPYYWNLADEFVLFDKYFTSYAGGSLENHFYWTSAFRGIDETGTAIQDAPTIFDRLQEAGVTWKFYVQNYDPNLTIRTVDQYPSNRASQIIWAPILRLDRFIDDPELNKNIVDLSQYYEDLKNGTLPQVAYMVPSGPSEHPPSNIQSGMRFVKTLIQMLTQSDYWEKSAFLLVYDDWGGWYDHVPPPQVDDYGYGMRVPAIMVSAFAKKGYVDSTHLDFASILKFIEYNWDLEPLQERDANANTFLDAFDFSQPPRERRFVPLERDDGTPKPEPNRGVIFLIYGSALGLAALFIAFTVIWTRRPPRQRKQSDGLATWEGP
jgi:phospholipase C